MGKEDEERGEREEIHMGAALSHDHSPIRSSDRNTLLTVLQFLKIHDLLVRPYQVL
jgi:hypothetical protein